MSYKKVWGFWYSYFEMSTMTLSKMITFIIICAFQLKQTYMHNEIVINDLDSYTHHVYLVTIVAHGFIFTSSFVNDSLKFGYIATYLFNYHFATCWRFVQIITYHVLKNTMVFWQLNRYLYLSCMTRLVVEHDSTWKGHEKTTYVITTYLIRSISWFWYLRCHSVSFFTLDMH